MSTLTVNPSGYDSTRSTWKSVTNIENAYADTESTTYARISLVTGGMANTYVYFTFDLSSIPQNATINSVSCSVNCSVSNQNTAKIAQKEIQLFTGTTAKGTATIMPTTYSVVELDTGTWTRQEINDLSLRFFVQRGYSGGNNNYEILAYGADLTIDYTTGGSTETLKIKSNGNWQDISKVYLKQNGTWTEQENLSTLFDTEANYVKGN